MNEFDIVIKSDKVFIDGRLIDCCIGAKDGIISTISKEKLTAKKVIDAEGKIVLPGTVDPMSIFELPDMMKEKLLKVAQKMLL